MTTADETRALIGAASEALTEASFRTGEFTAARELAAAAHAATTDGGDLALRATTLDLLGMLAHYENIARLMNGSAVPAGDIEAEETLFRQALTCWQNAGLPAESAQSVFGLGLVFQVLHSDWFTAMPYYWQALGLVAGPDSSAGEYLRSEVHRHVGFYFLVEAGQPAEAVRHLQISLDLREQLGDPRRVPSGLVALAQAELEAGNRDRAVELLRRAVDDARAAGLVPARIEDAERVLAEAEGATGP